VLLLVFLLLVVVVVVVGGGGVGGISVAGAVILIGDVGVVIVTVISLCL